MFEITDTQKIGVGLAGFGMFFLFLGVLLLFDKGLLAIGNWIFTSSNKLPAPSAYLGNIFKHARNQSSNGHACWRL
ncbi:hypothetical protein G9C98_006581 [Cotesia typhae]|uniref:Uncharacterized protein n=1 Tax=Cotesia typhae TaxID=2053667 RepID=A0A8J5V8Z6_9HYME|nr:hypothetical protein G9C98_006581 [Cotesia typhae]